jgi:primosomal protein N' (replication factor Y)
MSRWADAAFVAGDNAWNLHRPQIYPQLLWINDALLSADRSGGGTLSADAVFAVALDAPVMRPFHYLPPAAGADTVSRGQRVLVPFRRGERVGVVLGSVGRTQVASVKLRRIAQVLDAEPLLDDTLMALLDWAAAYYQHPPGEVYATALPRLIRHGRDIGDREASESPGDASSGKHAQGAHELTAAQAEAVAAITAAGGFQPFLLEGVTGSGKTEVYLQCIARQLAAGRQSLVLVPEIGLTPQLVERFRRRFPATTIVVLHSGLTDRRRMDAWLLARDGRAGVVIGTRSAVFAPLPQPGLIVVDEEHDSSFKQQEGFRYSARDIAVWRARQLDVPVVLGSATPSLESLANVESGRYRRLELPDRAGVARHPDIHIVDLRRHAAPDGLAYPLVAAIERHLQAGGQVMLFLNRRGFAPTLLCPACGACLECRRCDARMVLHRGRSRVVCHHCGSERDAPERCPECNGELYAVGQGTERLETALGELFPDVGIVRIDRDTTRRRGELERHLDEVTAGRARILLGTQMLTKGHDFPNLTLVGIVDADQGLFGTDFRASERLAQIVVQVAGRAGRGEKPGEVYLQSLFPAHPLLTLLVREGYDRFATEALAERRSAGWPPYTHLALLRAEATQREAALGFLADANRIGAQLRPAAIHLLGPAPAPMERRGGRYRAQLLVHAAKRTGLQRFLGAWRERIGELPTARRVRWSLDVDPIELY